MSLTLSITRKNCTKINNFWKRLNSSRKESPAFSFPIDTEQNKMTTHGFYGKSSNN